MRLQVLLFVIFGLFASCDDSTKKQTMTDHKEANHLIDETSPYLLQHAYNPVDWYPWGEEALEKARKENKLLLISIGYAACHWCHVMEHESFEDSTVADLMNTYFVNIKVDREERPDIDDIYMTACQMVSGRGCGWPLNCFALPDGRPVWAGTYFPKKEWMRILDVFNNMQQTDREKLEKSADEITKGIRSIDKIEPLESESDLTIDQFDEFVGLATEKMDMRKGGRRGAPKFPMPNMLQLLLNSNYYSTQTMAQRSALLTLTQMARGGIYDQLGGGFARYSVDENWLVPHFEKMLYDNGQLLSVYSDAFKLTGDTLYQKTVFETIDFLQRELMSDEGGFYSSLDADSEGEEGKFYVWTPDEVKKVLSDESMVQLFNTYYNVTDTGNWEGKSILNVTQDLQSTASNLGLPLKEAKNMLDQAREQLLEARSTRIRPGLDDKILCSWNGLALKGLIDAYEAFGRDEDLQLALKNARFIEKNFVKDDFRLDRNYKNGMSKINGFLDDYAFVIDAYTALYQVTFDEHWLKLAKSLSDYAITHFFDDDSGFYFYTSDKDEVLVARKKEKGDNVIPGSNSAMARNLHLLGHLLYDETYLDKASYMMQLMSREISDSGQPNFYANWCILYSEMMQPMYEVAILGEEANRKAGELQSKFLPNVLYLGGQDEGTLQLLQNKLQEGRTMIYVCQNKTCKLPVSEIEDALNLIQ